MALPATTVWEVENGGNDNNGGGFNSASGGTDRTLQVGAQVTIDGVTITATCSLSTIAFTGGTYTVLAGDVGNVVNMITGSGLTPGRYCITSVVAGLNGGWVLDRSTGMVGGAVTSAKMGGCLATIAPTVAIAVGGNVVYVKYNATPYSITTGVVFTASLLYVVGYNTTRTTNNTDALRPTLQAGASTITVITTPNYGGIANLIIDGNSAGSYTVVKGIVGAGYGFAINCLVENCTSYGISNTPEAINCVVTGGSAGTYGFYVGTAGMKFVNCVAYGNNCPGFYAADKTTYYKCVSLNNIGATSHGFGVVSSNASLWIGCVSYGNGGDGWNFGGSDNSVLIGCHAEGNTGKGYNGLASYTVLLSCTAFTNSGGTDNTPGPSSANNNFALGGSPFVAVSSTTANCNFGLNNTAGAGAVLRANSATSNTWAALPLTIGYTDIGAAQHQDSPSTTTNIFVIDD